MPSYHLLSQIKLALPLTLLLTSALACNLPSNPPPTETAGLLPSTTQPPPSPSPDPPTSTPSETATPTHTLPPTSTLPPTITPTATPLTTPNAFFDYTKIGTSDLNLPYCTGGSQSLYMDVYYPYTATRSWPVVILVHGGTWMSGDKSDGITTRFIEPLRRAEYLVVAVNYRLSPQFTFPAHLQDLKCAVRHIRANTSAYNLDPDRIAMLGFSAGGHLAALVGVTTPADGFEGQGGYREQSSRIQAVIDLSGPTNLRLFCDPNTVATVFGAESCDDRDTLDPANPATYLTPDDPPFLIIHGNRDTAVHIGFSEYLQERLDEAGVFNIFMVVDNAGHSYDTSGRQINPTFDEIAAFAIQFLNAVLLQ